MAATSPCCLADTAALAGDDAGAGGPPASIRPSPNAPPDTRAADTRPPATAAPKRPERRDGGSAGAGASGGGGAAGSGRGSGARSRRPSVGSPCSQRSGSVMEASLRDRASTPHKSGSRVEAALRKHRGGALARARIVVAMTAETPDGFALFLARIARTPLLSADEELRLARRVERGDLAAKERLAEANLRLVVHVAKRFQRDDHALTLPDLVQEGALGLMRAVEKFDHRRGYRFSTYAVIWIRQSIGRAIADKGRTIRLPAHVDRELRALDREERRLLAELGRVPSPAELAEAVDRLPDEVAHARVMRRTTVSLHEPVGDGIELGALIPQDAADAPDARAESAALGAEVRAALDRLTGRERAVLAARYGLEGDPATVTETARRLGLRAGDVRRLEGLALRKLRASPQTA